MTAFDPRTSTEILNDLKERLTNKIPKLTNFVSSSFNYLFTRAFAREQHEIETAATAVQLSGWADYSGKELTQDDLDVLGIDGATPAEINQFMDPEDLEEYAKGFGVSRDPPSQATGTVEFTTNSSTTILEGTSVGTQPDSSGDFIEFETNEDVSSSGAETVSVGITAVDGGNDGNVGAGSITYLPSPPPGVDSVTNPSETTGGVDEQTTKSLREDVKNAVLESAEGGTVDGLEQFIENETNATSAIVNEKFTGDADHGSYPHGDVVVYGGTDTEVKDAIQFAKPSAVEHILVRPTVIETRITIEAEGSNINTTTIEDELTAFFDDLELNETVYRDQIIQEIMNADRDIDNLSNLDIEVLDEVHTYDGSDTYVLNQGLEDDYDDGLGITEVTGTLSGSSHTFVEDTDYREWNSTAGDTSVPQDAINWGLAGDVPDNGTDFFVDYVVEDDIIVSTQEVAQLNTVNITVV